MADEGGSTEDRTSRGQEEESIESVGLGPVDYSRVDCGEITLLRLWRILEDGSSPNYYHSAR